MDIKDKDTKKPLKWLYPEKRKVKRLSLERWMLRSDAGDMVRMGYEAVHPVFGKNGYYHCRFDGGTTWFEIDGLAFVCPRADDFLYCLALYDAPYYRRNEQEAFEVLAKAKLLDKKTAIRLQYAKDRENLRRMTTNSKLDFRKRKGNN